MRIALLLLVVMLVACSPPLARPTSETASSPRGFQASEPREASVPRFEATPTPAPQASVSCTQGGSIGSLALIGPPREERIYEVSDPLHPRLLCRATGTTAHLWTSDTFMYLRPVKENESEIVLRSLGSGNETKVGTFPSQDVNGSWLADGSAATWTSKVGQASNGTLLVQVWLYAEGRTTMVSTYSLPGVDSFGRPGLAPPIDDLSPDGQYLIAGWQIVSKPGTPSALRLFRVSDRTEIPLSTPSTPRLAFWPRKGHSLYIVEADRVQSWSPDRGLQDLPGAGPWVMSPNFSPDGSTVAYTSLQEGGPRVSTYDLAAQRSRLIIDKPRSQAVWVKQDWVWYLEEAPCVQTPSQPCFDPSSPTGIVLARNLVTGDGGTVSFAPGASFGQPGNWSALEPGDLWPLT